MSSKRRIHALLKTRTSELPGDPTLQIKRVPGRFNTGLQKVAPTYRRVNAPDIPATESGAQTQKVRATAIMCPLLRGSLNRYPRPTLPPPNCGPGPFSKSGSATADCGGERPRKKTIHALLAHRGMLYLRTSELHTLHSRQQSTTILVYLSGRRGHQRKDNNNAAGRRAT